MRRGLEVDAIREREEPATSLEVFRLDDLDGPAQANGSDGSLHRFPRNAPIPPGPHGRGAMKKCQQEALCRGPESNWRHMVLQTIALPTELPRRDLHSLVD